MGSTCIELDKPAGHAVTATAGGTGRRHQQQRGIHRKRFLRRAAVGIAGTGWAFFGAADLHAGAGPKNGAASAPWHDIAFEDGSLRSTGLAGISPRMAWLPFGDSAILDRKYQQRDEADDPAIEQFAADVRERLPHFQTTFEQAALHNGMDWRLLAAMGYQESTWNPRAVSPTGVRGIMMLTLDTADELDVDRDNPAQSIRGGAEYFEQIRERLPPQIHEPDRTLMALAAYNQGIGHLSDARRLAAELGGSPDRWKDVRAALPLLSDERWFSKTRHGYARGNEAVRFVSRVRDYYGMLTTIPTDDSVHMAPHMMVASAGM